MRGAQAYVETDAPIATVTEVRVRYLKHKNEKVIRPCSTSLYGIEIVKICPSQSETPVSATPFLPLVSGADM